MASDPMRPLLFGFGIGTAGMILGICLPGTNWGPCGPVNGIASVQLLLLLVSPVILLATTLALAFLGSMRLLRRGPSQDS